MTAKPARLWCKFLMPMETRLVRLIILDAANRLNTPSNMLFKRMEAEREILTEMGHAKR